MSTIKLIGRSTIVKSTALLLALGETKNSRVSYRKSQTSGPRLATYNLGSYRFRTRQDFINHMIDEVNFRQDSVAIQALLEARDVNNNPCFTTT